MKWTNVGVGLELVDVSVDRVVEVGFVLDDIDCD
jgi:hypothetical protein